MTLTASILHLFFLYFNSLTSEVYDREGVATAAFVRLTQKAATPVAYYINNTVIHII